MRIFGKNKYKNKKVSFGNESFDSKKELNRYLVLKDAEKRGVICNLRRQVRYELIPSITEEYIEHLKTKDAIRVRTVQKAITYTADFVYEKDGKEIIEDVKASPKSSSLDKSFVLKEKLFRWKYGFPIKRIYKATDEI